MPIIFCNISWMREYQGHHRIDGLEDPPQRGGRYVEEHGEAHECCNFLQDDDGIVYGHVETYRGEVDTQIRIENLDANPNDLFIDGIDVVWISTHENGGRRVVGWYRNARIYRNRQYHVMYPTHQHRRDNVESYRITTTIENTTLLAENDRVFQLGNGPGWPGHHQVFYPENHLDNNEELVLFLGGLNELMNRPIMPEGIHLPENLGFNPEWCGQGAIYVPDVIERHRIHGRVVNHLYTSLQVNYGNNIFNNQLIDLAIVNHEDLQTIFEVKTGNDRQSIYTGVGQLLLHSNADNNVTKVLVLPTCENGYALFDEVFELLGIHILQYQIENNNINFINLPDLPLPPP